jgi:ABC-type glycerol-3-phosphate transport system substrate-binding protein
MTRLILVRLFALTLLLVISACADSDSQRLSPTPQRVLATATPPSTETPVPPTATPSGALLVQVWWPDSLAPLGDEDTARLLSESVDTFVSNQTQVRVEIRLKRAANPGGILQILQSASTVAPGALPDLTLMRRDDLLVAARSGLIQPFPEGSTPQSDLFSAGISLAAFDNVTYGLPFMLEVDHIAYRTVTLVGNFSNFEAVLTDQQGFTFPAGGSGGARGMLLAQYLSAGGSSTDLSTKQLNIAALTQVYDFYARGVTAGLFDASLLGFTQTGDYLKLLTDGDVNAALVTSSDYLAVSSIGLGAAAFPLAAGDPISAVDGWLWVMITADHARQAAALRFVDWMANPVRMSAYSAAAGMLPARRGALQLWSATPYRALVDGLLMNGFVLPTDERSDACLRAIEAGLTAVLSGQRTAQQAAQDAAASV